jgi:Arc/MetJ-type ribon-helix-helix transcriptional regulator
VQPLATIATPAKLGKHQAQTVHPISVLFTPQQVQWLDRQRTAGLSRSAVIRLVVEEAMRREQEQRK